MNALHPIASPEQIVLHRPPSLPTKQEGYQHAIGFEGDSVELDALPPRILKSMPRAAIERHITPPALEMLRVAERSERDLLRALGEQFDGGAHG